MAPVDPPSYPPQPDADELFKPYALLGPFKPHAHAFTIYYQIIDRNRTAPMDRAFHPNSSNFQEATPVVFQIAGQDEKLTGLLAANAFGEFKRRLLYDAGQVWQEECDRIRQAHLDALAQLSDQEPTPPPVPVAEQSD
jgi:hypothetical protein